MPRSGWALFSSRLTRFRLVRLVARSVVFQSRCQQYTRISLIGTDWTLTQFTREVWSEGNIEASDKYIAPKYTVLHGPGDPWEGRELDLAGYKERVKALRAAFPDQCFDIQELFADGDAVVMTWLWSATHKGDIPGFPATGKQIKMSGATVYYFDGSRLAGHWQITDRLGVYQQLRQAAAGA